MGGWAGEVGVQAAAAVCLSGSGSPCCQRHPETLGSLGGDFIFLRLLGLVGGGNQTPPFFGCGRKRLTRDYISQGVLQAKRDPVSVSVPVCVCAPQAVAVAWCPCVHVHVCVSACICASVCICVCMLDLAIGEQGTDSQVAHLSSCGLSSR